MQGGGPELSRQMVSCRRASALFYSLIYPERLASSPNDTSAIGRGNRRLDRPRFGVLAIPKRDQEMGTVMLLGGRSG